MSGSGAARSALVWHVHGPWPESFAAGRHHCVIPVNKRNWPRAQEIPWWQLRDADIDLRVLPQPDEIELATHWLGRGPGIDIPAVYVEHNAARPRVRRPATSRWRSSSLDRFLVDWDNVVETTCEPH